MRRLILKMSVSADGFVAGPNGEIDWLFRHSNEQSMAWTVGVISRAGLHLMGSKTFNDMAAYWPTSNEVYARPMNDIPKAYFSRGGGGAPSTTRALQDARAQRLPQTSSPADDSWRAARRLTGDLATEVARLKQEPGGDIVAHGGASFAQSLVAARLVDEYALLVHSVVLGRGLPLFSTLTAPLDLQLVDSRRFGTGAVAHVYRSP